MGSIYIRNLNKSFGQKKVLDNLSFDMKEHAITAIVGSNGIGKSVFLNCLLNFMEYDSGEIKIYEKNHNDHNYLRTVTSFISVDNQNHLNKVTPMEYFDLIISIYKLPSKSTLVKIERLSQELNVKSELLSSFDSLSFGTKKKVQLIGSIIFNPKLLICDEIFEGLDFEAVKWVKNYFLERKLDGLATLFTSHINEYIEETADEIYKLQNGQLKIQQAISHS